MSKTVTLRLDEKVYRKFRGDKIKVGDSTWPGMELIELPDLSQMKVGTRVNEVDVQLVELENSIVDTWAMLRDQGELTEAVYQGALVSGLFEASHIRVRALAYQSFFPGYAVDDFIHVNLRILSGRSSQQKKQLTEAVLTELEDLGLASISLTVEVAEV